MQISRTSPFLRSQLSDVQAAKGSSGPTDPKVRAAIYKALAALSDGIGMESAFKIFTLAIGKYMKSTATVDQAKRATLDACTELFGNPSVELDWVKAAWSK